MVLLSFVSGHGVPEVRPPRMLLLMMMMHPVLRLVRWRPSAVAALRVVRVAVLEELLLVLRTSPAPAPGVEIALVLWLVVWGL